MSPMVVVLTNRTCRISAISSLADRSTRLVQAGPTSSGKGRAPARCPVSKPIPSLGRLKAGAEDEQEADLGF